MIYRDISVLWSLINILFIFSQLYESKYPPRKTFRLNLIFMGALIVFNMYLLFVLGPGWLGKFFVLTCTIPSLVYFLCLAKDKNGRFFFTFCLADIMGFWVIAVTNIICWFCGNNYVLMLVLRILFFLILEFFIVRCLRRPYREVLRFVKKGWGGFAFASGLFYLFFALMANWPSVITSRPQELPAFLLFLFILPIVYLTIFQLLYRQSKLDTLLQNESILLSQLTGAQNQLKLLNELEEKNRILRHDFRHYINQVTLCLRDGNTDLALQYLSHFEEHCRDSAQTPYCPQPAVNACLVFYINRAEELGIHTEVNFKLDLHAIPDEVEFSIMLANSFENAIHGASALAPDQREIRVRCLCINQLLFEIVNTCLETSVTFDENHIPVSENAGHGIGTRSILAYAQKNNAEVDYQLENGYFKLRILFPSSP